MSLDSLCLSALSTCVHPNAGHIEDVRRALNSFLEERDLSAASFPVTKVEVLKASSNLKHESYCFFERAEKDKCPGSLSALWITQADDEMRICSRPGTSKYAVVAIIRFNPEINQVTLSDLARLASSIHNFKPSYNLAHNNCYWFAGAFVQYLLKKYQRVEEFSAVRAITENTQAGHTRKFGYFVMLRTLRPTDNEIECISQ
ncbi:hypothetical protein Agabi119p4_11044 [Agaricus bisporus var. burnettii]|uniref:PPPDE domain-containing protein n=1 Tax=Agaricus bisporus var. burnettii TaxID=192524 RepID=A0A8H7C1J0_AGABI|nr:hypothetical protein Agabi119p4_11044 [Agaricus bisporus var. burnettii]